MNSFRCLAWPAAGVLLAAPALAQTTPAPADTSRLRYTEEALAAPVAAPVTVARADRQQWKLGLNNFRPDGYPFGGFSGAGPYYTRYGLHLAYERRLGRAWSVQAEASPALVHVRGVGETDIQARFGLRGQLQGRYYYNQERRRRLGHRTAGFSANYLALAVGSGLRTGPLRETPFYLADNVPGGAADVALLYGVQRRLGRRGFLDASVGLTSLLAAGYGRNLSLNASLRVGLVLGPPLPASPVPAGEATSLRPRFFAGLQTGFYEYRLQYSAANPYPPTVEQGPVTEYHPGGGYYQKGYGAYQAYVANYFPDYSRSRLLPFAYAGTYLTPRLAVQVGVQRQALQDIGVSWVADPTPDNPYNRQRVDNQTYAEQILALPVQLRYALQAEFRRRWQYEVLGGLTPVWSAVEFHEYAIAGYAATSQEVAGFRRSSTGLHATLGAEAACGFGPRRRVQATAQLLAIRDVRTFFRGGEPVHGGFTLGLRYRFGYR